MGSDFDFGATRKQAEKEGIIAGGFLKVQDGSNRIRIVSRCLPDPQTFNNDKGEEEQRFKWLCLVLDRRDGQVKLYGMPHRVYKEIEKLQQTPDYEFSAVPMPYDISVEVENAGKINARYGVLPARKSTELTVAEKDAIAEKGSIEEIQKKLRGGRTEEHFDPDDIPA